MKLGILGTGMVGQALAGKLSELGHQIVVGTRDVQQTMANTEPHPYGFPSFSHWIQEHPQVRLASYRETAQHGEMVLNATNGTGSLAALQQAGAENLNGKILIDIANPLDFSKGNPPLLSISNHDSLAEQIQRTFPQARVVKTLNTVTAFLMVNPGLAGNGDHSMFVCGNDADAKSDVVHWLKDSFGWKDVLDLGDISSARGMEMYLPLWLRMWSSLGTGMFNIKIVK